jgi:hypothetical protein
MRLGIDFDNTIVSYDALFHKVALEQGAVPSACAVSKLAVRDHLRGGGKEDVWTAMQGYVYGARMDEAEAFPGVLDFLAWARDAGITLAIISHRTRYPYLGPRYDLHDAARSWVETHLRRGECPLVPADCVFFTLTREEKLRCIADWRCDYFIDDLPEVLEAPAFPAGTVKLLFDPDGAHETTAERLRDWSGVRRYFEYKCQPTH